MIREAPYAFFSGVDYGAACTGSGTGDCTDKTNTMCDTTCKCTAGFFRKGGKECAASKHFQ